MKEIILKHLNELGKDLEKSYGNKLILLDEKDFDKFADMLVKKLTIPVVSNRRELLKAFKEWERWDYKKPYDTPTDEIINDYMSLL